MEYPEEEGIDIHEYLNVLYRRKKVILLILAVVFLSTAFFTLTAPRVYEATTTLIVEAEEKPTSLPFAYSPMGRNLLQNYCQLLKSTTLAERVWDALRRLDPSLPILQSSDGVKSIEDGLSVKPVRETDLIEVSAQARSAQEATLIANTIAEEFVEQQLSVVRGEFTEQRRFLEEQLPIVEVKLTESEEELKKFKESNQLVSLSEETKEQTKQLLEFDLLYGQTQTEYDATLRRLSYMKNQLAEQKESLMDDVTQVASPFIVQLRKELVTLETNYSLFLVQGLPADHPKLVTLKSSIDEVKKKLKDETRKILSRNLPVSDPLSFSHELADKILALEVEVVALKAKKDALSRIRDDFTSRLRSLPEKELYLARLEREYKINANTYSMLMEKYEEVKIAEAGKIANVRIVDRASVPESPIKPKKKLNMLLGIVIGLGLGLGAAFLLEYVDTSIRNLAEVERLVNLPILGAIPQVKTKVNKKDQIAKIASHLITHHVPKSPISETFRAIRTNLQFVNPDDPLKTIVVTSSMPEEGKTTVAVNLAIVLAQSGAKTILVDADLRKPVVHRLFGLDSNHGLTDLLMGKTGLSSVIRLTDIPNLKLLPSGAVPPNPSELLSSKRMKSVIERLKEHFDYVIFDSPPAIPVTDAAVLGSEVDGTLMVVEIGRTQRHALSRAKEMLENVRARLVGVVLNNIASGLGPYSHYHYYHYYHKYYPDARAEKGRRVHRATALISAGVVSVLAITLGWVYWGRHPEPPVPSGQVRSAVEENFSVEPVLTVSEDVPSENRVDSKNSVDEMAISPVGSGETPSKESIPKPVAEAPVILPTEQRGSIADLKIFFEEGDPLVKPEYYYVLETVADTLGKDLELQLEVCGYSDNSGTDEENLILSENRAAVVTARLIKVHGVEQGRLSFRGYGVANPIGDNSTSQGRASNRRVEFKVKGER